VGNPVHVTKNKTRVLDPGVPSAPMVVVYRGLGPETGKDYAYDTADWMIEQDKKGDSERVAEPDHFFRA
jgi:hypothetical protein